MNSLTTLTQPLREMAAQGGWVFWVLIALAFGIAFALISIGHFLHLPNAPRLSGEQWLGLLRPGKGDDRGFSELLVAADEMPLIEQQLFAQLERRIRFAFVLIGAAPLVGLLGTVSGMLAMFRGLSSATARAPMDVVSGGVSEALVTTQTGLVIAVPTLIIATVLRGHFQQLRFGFEKLNARVSRTAAGQLSTD
jgi:hypothetical protein